MHLPWLKSSRFLQNKLKTPARGVKAFCSWEPVSLVSRPSPPLPSKVIATTGYYWLFWKDSFCVRPLGLWSCCFPSLGATSSPGPIMNLLQSLKSHTKFYVFPCCPSLIFCHHPGRICLSWPGSKNISYISLIMSYYIVDNPIFICLSY